MCNSSATLCSTPLPICGEFHGSSVPLALLDTVSKGSDKKPDTSFLQLIFVNCLLESLSPWHGHEPSGVAVGHCHAQLCPMAAKSQQSKQCHLPQTLILSCPGENFPTPGTDWCENEKFSNTQSSHCCPLKGFLQGENILVPQHLLSLTF